MIDNRPHQAIDWTNGKEALRAIARRTGEPVWSRLWPKIEAIAERHATEVARDLRGDIAELRAELTADIGALRETLDRLAPHMAAVEQRVAGLERQSVDTEPDDEQRADARSLVDEIRSEHARVRTRLSAVAGYEQRITRLEQTITPLADKN